LSISLPHSLSPTHTLSLSLSLCLSLPVCRLANTHTQGTRGIKEGEGCGL
jgi:hypothetical protein